MIRLTDDLPPRDEHLRAALRHAPDADMVPSDALTRRVLDAARTAALPASTTRPGWGERLGAWLSALAQPPVATSLAGLMVAFLGGWMWWGQPLDVHTPQPEDEHVAAAPANRTEVQPPVAAMSPSPYQPAPETKRTAKGPTPANHPSREKSAAPPAQRPAAISSGGALDRADMAVAQRSSPAASSAAVPMPEAATAPTSVPTAEPPAPSSVSPSSALQNLHRAEATSQRREAETQRGGAAPPMGTSGPPASSKHAAVNDLERLGAQFAATRTAWTTQLTQAGQPTRALSASTAQTLLDRLNGLLNTASSQAGTATDKPAEFELTLQRGTDTRQTLRLYADAFEWARGGTVQRWSLSENQARALREAFSATGD
jgi:hypothetical protein